MFNLNKKEELFELFIEFLEEKGIDINSYVDGIPTSIFCRELGMTETIVKYLKEEKGYSYEKISEILGKKKNSIGNSYRMSAKKYPKRLDVNDDGVRIPYNIMKNGKLTIFEIIVKHLKEKCRLNYHNIALLLKRDDRTIWTIYNNSIKKVKLDE